MAEATIYHYRARVAALSRDRSPDDPELLAAKRDLRVARIQRMIDQLNESGYPELTGEQATRLASLLRARTAAPADKAVV